MGINRVKQAVEEYEQVVQEAARVYEKTLREAESSLRVAMSSTDPEPPAEDNVTMSRGDYENLQEQLLKVADFIKANPELR